MSNPTTFVAALSSSLAYTDQSGSGTLTGVDPIRYNGGLWLEEATTNYASNPSFETDLSTWSATMAGETLTQTTTGAYSGSKAIQIVGNGAAGSQGIVQDAAQAAPSVQNDVWTLSCYSRGNAGTEVHRQAIYQRDAGTSILSAVVGSSKNLTTTTTRISSTLTVANASTASVSAGIVGPSAPTTQTTQIDAIQLEKKAYATSYADSSLGNGYSASGSTHIRAASSASVATANHISPTAGSLAFRFTRKIDTGGTETILECGTAGSGTDYLSIYVNSSDKLVVSWNSDNAGAQTVTSTGSIAVDTEYLVITKWNGTSVSLSLNVGTPDTGTRAAAQGSWGAGALKLEASAGGAIFNGLLVANRPTKQTEDATLKQRPTWSARTLRDRIALGAMQLRPIGA